MIFRAKVVPHNGIAPIQSQVCLEALDRISRLLRSSFLSLIQRCCRAKSRVSVCLCLLGFRLRRRWCR